MSWSTELDDKHYPHARDVSRRSGILFQAAKEGARNMKMVAYLQ